MESQDLSADFLKMVFYGASFGIGHLVAVGIERDKFVALLSAKELPFRARFRLSSLIIFSSLLFHLLGIVVGMVIAVVSAQGLFALLNISMETRVVVGEVIMFLVSGLGACYGAGNAIASMWKQHRRHFPPSDDPPEPPLQGPLRGA